MFENFKSKKKASKKKTANKVVEEKPVKKIENTCRACAHVYFPPGDDVTRGTCRRYPTHTPVALKSFCGEFK